MAKVSSAVEGLKELIWSWVVEGDNAKRLPDDLKDMIGAYAFNNFMLKREGFVPKSKASAPKKNKKGKGGRKRGMSAADREEVSKRMRKYWAERRKAKK